MDILSIANQIINDVDLENMFKIVNQDNDDHFNYSKKSKIWYDTKYGTFGTKEILLGFNIYAQNPGDPEPFLLGTYESGHEVVQVLACLYNAIRDTNMYRMPEAEDGDLDV